MTDIFDTDTEPRRELDPKMKSILREVGRYIDEHYEPSVPYLDDDVFECSSFTDEEFECASISDGDLECSSFTDDDFEYASYSGGPEHVVEHRRCKSIRRLATENVSHIPRGELWDDRTPHRPSSLADMLDNMGKSFSDTLFEYIDKKGLDDCEAYKRSNIDRRTFSKIKCDRNYKPSKMTALCFVIGLHLNLEEANHLLSTAGLCLSHSSKFDVIIEYFIISSAYTKIDEVNETLREFGENILGYVSKDDLYARSR